MALKQPALTRERTEADRAHEQLLRRIALRDDAALEQLFSALNSPLFGVAMRLLERREDAEEVVQEAFLFVWQRAREYDPARGSVTSWMAARVRSRALDLLRARLVRARAIDAELRDEPTLRAETPLESLERRVDADRVTRALETLPRDQVVALDLAMRGGLSQSEIASLLDEPLGTIKTRMRRGMAHLATLLREA